MSDKLVCDATKRFVWQPSVSMGDQVSSLYKSIQKRDPHEKEFLQAVSEVLKSVEPLLKVKPHYLGVLEQMMESERIIMFRVPWVDDQGKQHINRGYRIQHSSALGPYKGGLRFHPTVNLSIMKFLAFEQMFKNALTGLGIGAAKGGSDFDPSGKSDNEVMRFCQSFMTALYQHIGINVDVPAGDINVGSREIGYLYGQYKRLTHSTDCSLTGRSLAYGGSHIRPEATGYGCVYFLCHLAKDKGYTLQGARCVLSGAGNVAQYAAEKLLELGVIPITFSDSTGYILEPKGFTREGLQEIMRLKEAPRQPIQHYCHFSSTATFHPKRRPWEVQHYDFAFPCATQNEVTVGDVPCIIKAGCKAVVEGANMPTTIEAIESLQQEGVVVCPAKAANAGGVAVSALEMAQSESRSTWSRKEVDDKLRHIMGSIYDACKSHAKEYHAEGNLVFGANIAGFLRVADAVYAQGCI